jgi:hypothetical protein
MNPFITFCAAASMLAMFVSGVLTLYGATDHFYHGRFFSGVAVLIVSGLCFTLCHRITREING